MVTKNMNQAVKEVMTSRVKVGKLQLKKETIKDLTPGKQKQIKGGKGAGMTACSKTSSDIT